MRDLSSTTGAEGADDDLGGRLPLLNPETISGEQRRLYDRFVEVQVPWARDSGFEMCAREGRLIGPFNALLRAPDISSPFMDWEESLRKSPLLSEKVRQVVTLAVGAEWNGVYELYAHTAVGRTAGLPDEVIQAIKEHRRPEGVSEAARAAYRLVESLMLTYDVPDAVYTAAVAALGANGVVAVVQLAGHYITVCAMLNAFRIPTPDG